MAAATNMPRIAPVEPPYTEEVQAMLSRWMPPGASGPPLALFRTLAIHLDLAGRMRPLGAGILGHGLVDAREREIVIHRTCARAGSEYEWGVHAVAFAGRVGLSPAQLTATASGEAGDPSWSERDALLIRLADELHDGCRVSPELWAELAARWTPAQLLELLVIAGWYRLIAYITNGAAIEREPWGMRWPAAVVP